MYFSSQWTPGSHPNTRVIYCIWWVSVFPRRYVRATQSSLHILNHFPSTSHKVGPLTHSVFITSTFPANKQPAGRRQRVASASSTSANICFCAGYCKILLLTPMLPDRYHLPANVNLDVQASVGSGFQSWSFSHLQWFVVAEFLILGHKNKHDWDNEPDKQKFITLSATALEEPTHAPVDKTE